MTPVVINFLNAARDEVNSVYIQTNEPRTSSESHHRNLGALQQRFQQLDARLHQGDPLDLNVQQRYETLQFQITYLIDRILRNDLASQQPLATPLGRHRVAPMQPETAAERSVTTISGTLSQYSVKKNGKTLGDGACTYCAISAIKRLFSPIMSGQPISQDMIDATVKDGIALSPDHNYGDFLGLLVNENEHDLRHVHSLNGYVAIAGFRNPRTGYQGAIDELYTLAQRNGGHLAAGCTLNPMSYALFINAKTNTFYFYDSHGDTNDPTTGATREGGPKAFVKIFKERHQLVKYLNQRQPFDHEHGDQNERVTCFDGSMVPNYNIYHIVPVSLWPQGAVANEPPIAAAAPSIDEDEALARLLQEKEEREAQLRDRDALFARTLFEEDGRFLP